MSGTFHVYILASRPHGTLYVGVTRDLVRRVWEHAHADQAGFTKAHGVNRLVYFEAFEDVEQAIAREKQLKGWRRDWKIALIEKDNPNWSDFAPSLGPG